MGTWNNRTFEGGLNQDKSEYALAPNEYSYALNIRNAGTEGGKVGVVTNAKGNEEVSFTLPTGSNRVIGSYSDTSKERIFYFVWNSEEDHLVLQYSVKSSSISKVMQSSSLEFDFNFLITGVAVIYDDDNSDLLYFTDDNSEPKVIAIDAGIRSMDTSVYRGLWSAGSFTQNQVVYFDINNYRYFYRVTAATTSNTPYTTTTDPNANTDWELSPIGYVYPDTISVSDLSIMPSAPTQAPEVEYFTDWQVETNTLRGRLWKFKYKWVYSDNRESAWSPISQVPIPDEFISPLSTQTSPSLPSLNNTIIASIDRNSDSLVKSVKVSASYGGDDKAPSDFFLIDDVDVYDLSRSFNTDGFADVRFQNNEIYSAIDISDSNNLFSWCPRKAKSLELINGNVVAMGNVLEGYELDLKSIREDPPNIELDIQGYPSSNSYTVGSYTAPDNSFTATIGVVPTAGTIITSTLSVRYYDLSRNDVLRERVLKKTYVVTSDDTTTTIANNIAAQFSLDSELYIGFASELESPDRIVFYSPTWKGESYLTASNAANVITFSAGSFVVGRKFPLGGSSTIALQFVDLTVNSETITQSFEYGGLGKSEKSFKRNHPHKLGIVYSDDFGRVSTVVTHPNLSFTPPPFSSTSVGPVSALMSINHEPPSWATKAHIVKTKTTPNSIYVCTSDGGFTAAPFSVNDYFEVDNGTGTQFVQISLSALSGLESTSFNSVFSSSVLSYSFTKGDRVRFISNKPSGSTQPTAYYEDDLEIYKYDPAIPSIFVKRSELSTTLAAIFAPANEDGSVDADVVGLLMEIYTPQRESSDELFYETGITLDITGGFHVGNRQTQTASQPAIVYIDSGDVYYKPRGYVYDISTPLSETYYVEDLNFSDFYESKFTDLGRPNLVIKETSTNERKSGTIGQVRRNTLVRYSQPFVPETNINGTGTFFDLDFKEYDKRFQSIQYLYSEGDRMIIFQEDRVGFSYINRDIYQSLNGSTTVSASPEVLSDVTYYSGVYGISTQPESFAVNGNRKYFTDVNRGVVCRLSQDGITPISFNGMDDYFKENFNNMFVSPEKDICIGIYDKRFDEYIINLKSNEDITTSAGNLVDEGGTLLSFTFSGSVDVGSLIVGQTIPVSEASDEFLLPITAISGSEVTFDCLKASTKTQLTTSATGVTFNVVVSKTLAYNERIGAWSSFYSYIPEWMSESALDIVTFVGGHLWKHNSNSTRNNFYGTQYISAIETVCNDNPKLVKNWMNINLASDDNWYVDDYEISTSLGQTSNIKASDFKLREGNRFSPFFRDFATGGSNTYSGDKLRGNWIKSRLSTADTGEVELFAIGFNYFLSQYTR